MITLRKDLGQAGACLGDLSGPYDSLPDVLKAMCAGPVGSLEGRQDTIAVATIAGTLINSAGKLTGLRTSVGTCGTAGNTVVAVTVNGVSKGSLTTANDAVDGTKKSLSLDVDLAAGDLVELAVTSAPTGGANLTASCSFQPVKIES
jgi:hypothetical protein